MKTEQILQLVEAVSGFGLDEFEYEEDGVKLKLKKGGNVCTSVSAETAGRRMFFRQRRSVFPEKRKKKSIFFQKRGCQNRIYVV